MDRQQMLELAERAERKAIAWIESALGPRPEHGPSLSEFAATGHALLLSAAALRALANGALSHDR